MGEIVQIVIIVFPSVFESSISSANLLHPHRHAPSFLSVSAPVWLSWSSATVRSLPGANQIANMAASRVIVYGGRGALGSKCVQHFKSKGWVSDNSQPSVLNANTGPMLNDAKLTTVHFTLYNPQWVASIDMAANEEANENVIVKLSESFTEQAAQVSNRWHRQVPTNVSVSYSYQVARQKENRSLTFTALIVQLICCGSSFLLLSFVL